MANFGAVGLAVYAWFLLTVGRMIRQTLALTQGRQEHAIIWGMVAAMIGYWSWSFVEFSFDEKPFWEFLALFTVCWSLSRNPENAGQQEQKQ
jgi:hypothetical protein